MSVGVGDSYEWYYEVVVIVVVVVVVVDVGDDIYSFLENFSSSASSFWRFSK